TFHDLGVNIETKDIAPEEGANADEIISNILHAKGHKLDPEQIQNRTKQKREEYRRLSKASIIPETAQLIDRLQKNSVKLGLVTGSIISSLKHVVDDEFLGKFDVIITSDDVTETKPSPEPYLVAAEKLNVAPENCVVIENAPKGIESAKRAGMKCVALRTTIKDDAILSKADVIVDHALEVDIHSL
ncbi:HAD-IA family hydrolase, partial [candidate division KSB1 bacterium]|nr:HAD-IA family hydrolase [candidate division KSB1 bacterium]